MTTTPSGRHASPGLHFRRGADALTGTLAGTLAAALAAVLPSACHRPPPEEARVDGRPVAEWIVIATNADNPQGQRAAWLALRHAGPPAVPAIRRAMERTTDPELRARVGLTFSFLCPSAVPVMAEEARTAQGDVQTQLEMSAQAITRQAEGPGGPTAGVGRDGC